MVFEVVINRNDLRTVSISAFFTRVGAILELDPKHGPEFHDDDGPLDVQRDRGRNGHG